MNQADQLKNLPDWPGRMKAPVAAAYMGIATTTFLTRFRSFGVKEGGNLLWARAQLDRMIADQFGMGWAGETTDRQHDPYLAWKAGRLAGSPVPPQARNEWDDDLL